MEIKVGILHVNREIVVETTENKKSIEESFENALRNDGVFSLIDERGRKVIIPAAKVAYLDLGQENARHVGFGNI